jgi:hypothetical protein
VIGDEKIVEWFQAYKPLPGIAAYHINHDISKPYIIEYDDQGRAHYPNHWVSSSKMFRDLYGDSIFADLILHDMDFHTAKGEELTKTWALPYADHLYATAWAAIFSNAELFGGTESDSFKIKRKKLIKAFRSRP